jgi:hypothetical protein
MNSSNQLRKEESWCHICGFMHTIQKKTTWSVTIVININRNCCYFLGQYIITMDFFKWEVFQCLDCQKEELGSVVSLTDLLLLFEKDYGDFDPC